MVFVSHPVRGSVSRCNLNYGPFLGLFNSTHLFHHQLTLEGMTQGAQRLASKDDVTSELIESDVLLNYLAWLYRMRLDAG